MLAATTQLLKNGVLVLSSTYSATFFTSLSHLEKAASFYFIEAVRCVAKTFQLWLAPVALVGC